MNTSIVASESGVGVASDAHSCGLPPRASPDRPPSASALPCPLPAHTPKSFPSRATGFHRRYLKDLREGHGGQQHERRRLHFIFPRRCLAIVSRCILLV